MLVHARRFQPSLTWPHGIALAGASWPHGNKAGGWEALGEDEAEPVVPDAAALLRGAFGAAELLGEVEVDVRFLATSRPVVVPVATSRTTKMISQGFGNRRRGGGQPEPGGGGSGATRALSLMVTAASVIRRTAVASDVKRPTP